MPAWRESLRGNERPEAGIGDRQAADAPTPDSKLDAFDRPHAWLRGNGRCEGARPVSRKLQLAGQTLLVIGGSYGLGFETARLARSEGAAVILTARGPDRLLDAGLELEASIAAFDATDFDRLERFFEELPRPIDHLVLSSGRLGDAPLADLNLDQARRVAERELWLPLGIAQLATGTIRPGGSLVFVGSTGGRPPSAGPLASAINAARSALARSLAADLAPVRVNLIAASLASAPLGRGVGTASVASVAVELMVDTAITGATVDVHDGHRSA
jgi:NAD(P)-dependent dehydrogenase (short-subunit alcohol dehydrogenase family)